MNAVRTLRCAILVSASTRWVATAASAPVASKQRGTSRCVLVSCFGSCHLSLVFSLWSQLLRWASNASTVRFKTPMVLVPDVDECERQLCGNGTCKNTVGSYNCLCYPGFQNSHNSDCIGGCMCDCEFKRKMRQSRCLHVMHCVCALIRRWRMYDTEGLVSKRTVFEHCGNLLLWVQWRLCAHPRRPSVCR